MSTLAPAAAVKPTVTETSLAQRQAMVARHAAGESYRAIARELGVSRRTVMRWVLRERREGPAALSYRSHRPQRPHPATLAPAVVARIDAIRQAHAGWGARLIRRQLTRDGVTPLPAESTIQHWLARLGHPLVRPRVTVPLGWRVALPRPGEAVWQIDFKEKRLPEPSAEKGGAGI